MIEPGDTVVLLTTGEVGIVEEIFEDPSSVRVFSRGTRHEVAPVFVTKLEASEVAIINHVVERVAKVIDTFREEELYDPVYNEEGEIIYSGAAAAVLSTIAYPVLLVKLRKLREMENEF